jgi:deoxyribonuclease IV
MSSETSPLLIGAHVSVAGGLEKAFTRAEAIGCTAMQIFSKNANQWRARSIDADQAKAFRNAWAQSSVGPVIVHDSYLINLAAPVEDLWLKSLEAFRDEMERCALLGIPHLVMHPGAHLKTGEEAGLARVAEAFRRLFAEGPSDVTVLLENTAGQGSYLGGRFEHLVRLMEMVPEGRFGVCLDTCHLFAAGYDISSEQGYASVIEEFDRIVGIGQIRAFHVNDSKKGLGASVDRHEHIGQGMIGREGFAALMRDPRFRDVPKILETPKGEDDALDRMNLATLRELAGTSAHGL